MGLNHLKKKINHFAGECYSCLSEIVPFHKKVATFTLKPVVMKSLIDRVLPAKENFSFPHEVFICHCRILIGKTKTML